MYYARNENDEYIAEKFKRDYNEQFHILVRMHLSFLLDLNMDENETFVEKGRCKKWNVVPFGKKLKIRSVMEGAPLTQEGICQVYQLIEYLKNGERLKTEGIFRRTGSLERQQELRNLLNQGITVQLEAGTFNVHDCASVFKGFLADLSDPVLTETHFPVYCQIADSCGINKPPTQEGKLLEALQLLILLLPSENTVLLKDILELLSLTASFENDNRMSPDNLAKLFTPHLLCPRKLSPEALLKDCQTSFKIVSFMIKKSSDLFKIPQKLVLDFRARYEKKNLSPSKILNESITDTASTVFTFVDHERTAKENEANPTEKALAQLYAHIQSLPESSKKRKLVKQFNKENGNGTPLQVIRSGITKNKSLGESIKKHIFQKGLARRKGLVVQASSNEDILATPTNSSSHIAKTRLFCYHNHDSSSDASPAKRVKISHSESDTFFSEDNYCTKDEIHDELKHDLVIDGNNKVCNTHLTSTPACVSLKIFPETLFIPESQDRKSVSPITRSTQRMTRAMQETMMTPRSRKPVLLVSGTNITVLPKLDNANSVIEDIIEEPSFYRNQKLINMRNFIKYNSESNLVDMKTEKNEKMNKSDSPLVTSLSDIFKEYMSNRDMITLSSPGDTSFSSRTDDFNSSSVFQDVGDDKFSDSLLYCLDGNQPSDIIMPNFDKIKDEEERELVLKPKQFDKDGKIIFETSF